MGGEWVPKRIWWIVSPGPREGTKGKKKERKWRADSFSWEEARDKLRCGCHRLTAYLLGGCYLAVDPL